MTTELEPSGAQWCSRFPTSTSVDDLEPTFAANVRAFRKALFNADATYKISATYRPPERAYLMHYCGMIHLSKMDPAAVPPMAGVDIDWTHGGDLSAAVNAAGVMFSHYNIRYPAALVSRHTQRLAIDMTIFWTGALAILDGHNQRQMIGGDPCSGDNPRLWEVGRTFGVIKLPSDPPHWSVDGH